MGFSEGVRMKALLWSDRHCCLCKKASGVNIEVHHIEPKKKRGRDAIDNAIPLCFDCHCDVMAYNTEHPRGSRYRIRELRARRDQVYEEFTRGLVPPIHYQVNQRLPNGVSRTFPDVGFILSHAGDSLPVCVRVRVEVIRPRVRPILLDGYYSGTRLWHLNPGFTIFGHFQIPSDVQTSRSSWKVRVTVTIVDQYARDHAHLPVHYTYLAKEKSWVLEP